jgi:hypothetical protein
MSLGRVHLVRVMAPTSGQSTFHDWIGILPYNPTIHGAIVVHNGDPIMVTSWLAWNSTNQE